MSGRFALGAVAVAALACATEPVAGPDRATENPGETVVVKPGETVLDIARASGLSVEEILEVNGLRSEEDVGPGDRLFLPAGRAHVAAKAPPEREEPAPRPTEGKLSWPVDGVVLRSFAAADARQPYDGLLVAAPAGTPVVAAADGIVRFVGDQGTRYGLFVVVEHPDDLVTVYAHLDRADVRVDDVVRRGEAVGIVGTTGHQESPRLHFQVRRGRTPVDPETLLEAPR